MLPDEWAKLAITGNNGTGKTSYLTHVDSIILATYRKATFNSRTQDSQEDDRTLPNGL